MGMRNNDKRRLKTVIERKPSKQVKEFKELTVHKKNKSQKTNDNSD
jgi:hypothetical protein